MRRFGTVLRFAQLRSCRRFSTANVAGQQQSNANTNASTENESEHSEEAVRRKVLDAALTYVPDLGWSTKALSAGAEAQGFPGTAHGMFPNGPADLITYFYLSCNDRLSRHLEEQKAKLVEQEEKLRITPFVHDAVETRLRMNIPYVNSWAQAMAIMATPQNAPQAWRNLSNLADEIWFQAGDTSVDMSWYTKRLSLAAIYKASEIHMLQDKSPDFVETWEFLDRRIDGLTKLAKTMRQAQGGLVTLSEVVEHGFTVGKNVLGISQRFR